MRGCLALIGALACLISPAFARTITACAPASASWGCNFASDDAIQRAVDVARDGDVIRIRRGIYRPATFRDRPFQDVVLRAFVLVDGKRISIIAEDGVTFDGQGATPTIAFVLWNSDVDMTGVAIENFGFGNAEDDIYDGHGVFVVGGRARLTGMRMTRVAKMGITGRNDALIDASGIRMDAGHMGVWLEETAHMTLRESIIRGGDSAGVGAYQSASLRVYNSVLDANTDDGVYAEGRGVIIVANSIITRNGPYGARAVEDARIEIAHSVLFANVAPIYPDSGSAMVMSNIFEVDPQLDERDRFPPGSSLALVRDPIRSAAIGLTQ